MEQEELITIAAPAEVKSEAPGHQARPVHNAVIPGEPEDRAIIQRAYRNLLKSFKTPLSKEDQNDIPARSFRAISPTSSPGR